MKAIRERIGRWDCSERCSAKRTRKIAAAATWRSWRYPRAEEAPAACECDSSGAVAVVLTVLGPGCKRCHQLNDNAQAAASKAGGAVSVEYVTDPVAIAEAGHHVRLRFS